MTILKTVTLAAVLIAGATSLAMAQNGDANGNNGMPPSNYKGPGAYPSYSGSEFQRPADANNNMPPASYKGPGAYQSYSSSEFQPGNPAANAAASGGSGTHATSQRTSTAENTQKVLRNQNGYRSLYSYYPGSGPAAADTAWCEGHYRSYDPATGTYRGFDGFTHQCP
jgi:BA14K-like protein